MTNVNKYLNAQFLDITTFCMIVFLLCKQPIILYSEQLLTFNVIICHKSYFFVYIMYIYGVYSLKILNIFFKKEMYLWIHMPQPYSFEQKTRWIYLIYPPCFHIDFYFIPPLTNNPASTRVIVLISFIKTCSEGPAVSLNGSPTVSPTTPAL